MLSVRISCVLRGAVTLACSTRLRPPELVPSSQSSPAYQLSPSIAKLLTPAHMSHIHPTDTSLPNFQLIFNDALKAYEKKTKKDLLAHPLAAQLQACDSPTAALAVLQQQVHEFNQSRSSDDKLTKWLDPTINVLYSFSSALGEGVGLVSFRTSIHLRAAFLYSSGRFSHPRRSSLPESVFSF